MNHPRCNGPALGGAVLASLLLAAAPSGAAELRGWPVRLDGNVGAAHPAVGDLDGDGNLEVVVAAGMAIHVLGPGGAPLDGWPLQLRETRRRTDDALARSDYPGTFTLCDLDGDRAEELVFTALDGRLSVVDGHARMRAGFPVEGGGLRASGAACADLDADGRPELVWAGDDGVLRAVNGQGVNVPGFPLPGIRVADGLLAVGDVHAQAGVEVAVGTVDGRVHLLGRQAGGAWKDVPGFPVKSEFTVSGGPVMADLDADGRVELAFGSQDFNVFAVKQDGSVMPGFPVRTGYRVYAQPAVADLDGDGRMDIIVSGGDGVVYALKRDGTAVRGWPVEIGGRLVAPPAVGDLDGDGVQEVVACGGDGRLHVLRGNGQPLGGYPVAPGGALPGSPVITDLNADGRLDVVVATATGVVHAYTFANLGQVKRPAVHWPTAGHDSGRVSRRRPNPALFLDMAIQPAVARTDDDLLVAYRHVDLDGDAERNTQVRWYRNGNRVAELDNRPAVPASETRKGEKWHYTVQEGEDFAAQGEGKGARIFTSPAVTIRNTAPTAPAVAVAPLDPDTLADLEARVEKPATDADGDAVQYAFRWIRNREPLLDLPLSTVKVPAARTRKGDTWRLVVVPSDGQEDGTAASAQVVIRNTPPGAMELAAFPEALGAAEELRTVITRASTDPDEDAVRVEYAWSLGGEPVPLVPDLAAFPARAARKGQAVSLVVTPWDNQAAGPAVQRTINVRNTPPLQPVARTWPDAPRTGDAVVAGIMEPSRDWDGDGVAYTFAWEVDGAPMAVAPGVTTIPGGTLRKGQRLALTATPTDGTAAGQALRKELTVADTAPGSAEVALEPRGARAGQPLQLVVGRDARDVDGDAVTYAVEWRLDGKAAPAAARDRQVPAGVTRKGQAWMAVVTASDGELKGAPAFTVERRVADTPPGAPVVALGPASPRTRDALTARITRPAEDVDGDAVSYRYRWWADGMLQDLGPETTVVPADRTRRGQVWRVEAAPVADGVEGAPAISEVTVVNTPPAAPVVVVEPAAPVANQQLRAVVKEPAADPDGDAITLAFRWTRNGQDSGVTGTTVPAGRIRKGERWEVVVDTHDGLAAGEPGRATVTVGNTPPVAPLLDAGPDTVRTTEAIVPRITRPASDVDGDAVTLTWAWAVDGKDVPALAGRTGLKRGDYTRNQQVVLTLTPSDGTARGAPVQVRWKVRNTAPTAPRVAFRKQQVALPESLHVEQQAAATDEDGDALRYRHRYFRNGEPLALPEDAVTVPPGMFARGDVVAVRVSAFDGEEEGPAALAEARILNAAPGALEVAFSPAQPTVSTPLEVLIRKPATDPDGDKLGQRYRYFVNDAPLDVPAGARWLPTRFLKKGDRWRVEVVADDGAATGPAAVATTTVVNTPPTAPTVAFTMKEGYPGVQLDVMVGSPAVDADGDPVTYRYAFLENGRPMKLPDSAAPSIPGARVLAGARYRVEVRAHDGEAESPVATAEVKVVTPPPPPRPGKDAQGKPIPPPPPPPPPEAPALPPVPASPPRALKPDEAPRLDPAITTQPALTFTRCEHVSPSPLAGQPLEVRVAWDGAAPQGVAVEWLRNGQRAAQVTGTTVPAALTRKGESWSARIMAGGRRHGACAPVRVGDTPPGTPVVALEPAQPVTGQELRAVVKQAATDPDGDKVAYRYAWLRGGVVQPLPDTADRLPGASVRAGDTWQVRVVAVADRVEGPAASAEVTVVNSPPRPPVVRVEPATPVRGSPLQAVVTHPAADVDGDPLVLTWAWSRNGVVVPAHADAVIPSGVLQRGESWEVRVTASDGAATAPAATSAVTVGNTAPSDAAVSVGPSPIRAGTGITATVVRAPTDVDGDAPSLSWAWKVNGKPVAAWAGRTTIPAAELGKNQRVRAEVTAADASSAGGTVHAEVQTLNTPPTAPVVAFVQTEVPVTVPLEVRVTTPATDADQDKLVYRHRFFRNGARVTLPETDSRVPSSMLTKGDAWDVEVVAFDGEAEGPPATARARVLNTAPAAPVIRVRPERPRTTDALTCDVVTPGADPDRDAPTYLVRWLRNGQETHVLPRGPLPAHATARGDAWSCRAAQWDGEALGPFADSAPVTVENTPPPDPLVRVEPAQPRVGQALECRVERPSVDADGDPVRYVLHWEKNDRAQPALDGAWKVPGADVRRGDRWGCWAEAMDGTTASSPRAPRVVVTVGNTPPLPPLVELRPADPGPGVPLSCEVLETATDPDGDRVSYRVEWLRNGQVQGFAPTQLVVEGKHTAPGQEWRCVLVASDGKAESPPARSPPVRIRMTGGGGG